MQAIRPAVKYPFSLSAVIKSPECDPKMEIHWQAPCIKEKFDSSVSLVGRAEMYMLTEHRSSYIFQKRFSAQLSAVIPECGHQHLTTQIFEAENWHQPRLHSPPVPSLAKQVKLCAWLEWRSWVESWVCSPGWELAKYFVFYIFKEDKGVQNMERMRLFGVVKKSFLCISSMRYFQIFQHLTLSLSL